MNPSFVVDASIALAWCYTDEATPETAALLDRLTIEAALVPSHWYLEVGNSLATAERRKRIERNAVNDFIALLNTLDINVESDTVTRVFSHILPLARTHQLTVYDATYLDLAVRANTPLATLDEDLRAAARQLGIVLLGK